MDAPSTLTRPGDPRAIRVVATHPEHLVLDKPAGLLSVPGRTEPDCLEARVRERFPEALTVHRLDMATSGLSIMARSPKVLAQLQRQFERRQTRKIYEAVVRGTVEGDQGTIDTPIRRDWESRPLQVIDHERGRETVTHWRVIGREPGRTRLELRPVTGRTHQLRLHMKSIGHPILGDEWYADAEAHAAAPRLLLHAREISFRTMAGGEATYRAACPF